MNRTRSQKEDPTILIRVMINLITEILVLFIFPRFLIRTNLPGLTGPGLLMVPGSLNKEVTR